MAMQEINHHFCLQMHSKLDFELVMKISFADQDIENIIICFTAARGQEPMILITKGDGG